MELILNETSVAIYYLFIAGVVSLAYKISSDRAEGGKYKVVLWQGLLLCGAIALYASLTLGSPSCEVRDPGDVCDQYADNGFSPTNEERLAKFTSVMVLLYVPVVVGALKNK